MTKTDSCSERTAGNDTGTAPPISFSFGKNWLSFLEHMPDEAMRDVASDIADWLGASAVEGKSVVDIGCGSGVHSHCFHAMGVKSLFSIDVDPRSVAATSMMWERAGKPNNWRVQHASILDDNFVKSLEKFDIVYSWGVLHHTGEMWRAIENASRLVSEGGLFWIALYTKGPDYPTHLELKKQYNRAGWLGKKLMIYRRILKTMRKRMSAGKNPFGWNERRRRGMDVYHDLIDWLGGLPYEVASPEEIRSFCEARGFELVRVDSRPEGACSGYLMRRLSESKSEG
jgi:SAM-dependent methyltransferase